MFSNIINRARAVADSLFHAVRFAFTEERRQPSILPKDVLDYNPATDAVIYKTDGLEVRAEYQGRSFSFPCLSAAFKALNDMAQESPTPSLLSFPVFSGK